MASLLIVQKDKLTPEEKNWLAIAICGAIIADGSVSPAEIRYLEQALKFLPSSDKVNSLINAVKQKKLPPLLELDASTSIKAQILIEISNVIASDNSLSIREVDYLFEIGAILGFEDEYMRMILRWSNEGIIWKHKMQHLLKVGEQLQP